MKKGYVLYGLAAVIGVFGWYLWSQYKKAMDFCYQVVGHKVTKLGLSQIVIELYLRLKNKSNIDLTIKSYDINVSINGKHVSTLKSDKPQYIKPKDYTLLTLNVSFNPADVLKNVFNSGIVGIGLDKSKIMVRMYGKITASHANLIEIKDFELDQTMPLSEMIEPKEGEVEC